MGLLAVLQGKQRTRHTTRMESISSFVRILTAFSRTASQADMP